MTSFGPNLIVAVPTPISQVALTKYEVVTALDIKLMAKPRCSEDVDINAHSEYTQGPADNSNH